MGFSSVLSALNKSSVLYTGIILNCVTFVGAGDIVRKTTFIGYLEVILDSETVFGPVILKTTLYLRR